MKLTIIPSDGSVYKNNVCYSDFDLSFIPFNVHALQWEEAFGEIEFKRTIENQQIIKPQNELITELPTWAQECVVLWDLTDAQRIEQERIAEEQVALEQAALEQAALEQQPSTTV
jgi:hypothetical protein